MVLKSFETVAISKPGFLPQYDTPRDRPTIEYFKDIFFLTSLFFYDESLHIYFDPRTTEVFLLPEYEEEKRPHLVWFHNLFDIPDGHLLESVFDWKDKMA